MTILGNELRYKPLDFGADGITGSVDRNGRIIALNSYHPQHGYVTLTSASPFPESERYNPAAVREYRAGLVNLAGFGFQVESEIVLHTVSVHHNSIRLEWKLRNGKTCDTEIAAFDGGIVQQWRSEQLVPEWGGQLSIQRCAYTQLTEGGPVWMPPVETDAWFKDGLLTIENRALPWAAAVAGLPVQDEWEQHIPSAAVIRLKGEMGINRLVYGFGLSAEAAEENARRLAEHASEYLTAKSLPERGQRFPRTVDRSEDDLLQRGLDYSLMLAVPVDEGVCFLTDHMILPLSWNRDAYYTARALLGWQPGMTNLVRRHLIWLFEQAERRDGAWGRCYLANGKIKDGAFQLDQQIFPILELAEYVLETGDQAILKRLQPHVKPLIEMMMQHKAPDAMLFATDETPADDPIALPYHLSSHILFWRVLTKLSQLGIEGDWAGLAESIRQAVDGAFIAERQGRRLYAYAANGTDRHYFYHDANDLPLALAPGWGFVPADNPVWRATVDFAFSEENMGGFYSGRLGSVHTRAGWSLGDIQDLIIARTLGDAEREQRAWHYLQQAAQWDGALPEAYDPETGEVISRHWFAWPNAALVCVIRGVFSS